MQVSNRENIDLNNLEQIETEIKTGQESLNINNKELPYKLLDFWKWSTSDLVSNATRGVFAEFIVATATNADLSKPRVEWDAYDLLTPDEIRIEVKSAAYIQTWKQKTLSKISFPIKQTRKWNPEIGKYENIPSRESDIYVFCHLKHKEQKTINPFNMEQWDFYVIATKELENSFPDIKSVTLKLLEEKKFLPVKYHKIYDEIKRKAGV